MAHGRIGLLLLLFALAGCAAQAPSFTRTGILPPGATIAVRNLAGDINVYAPERGQPANQYTISAFGASAADRTAIATRSRAITVAAKASGLSYLIRGSKGTILNVSTRQGSINVADFDGVVNAHDDRGEIKMLLPRYGNASVGSGDISVIFASTTWPGTLRFSAQSGDVELYVNENARAHIRLHTEHGTIFTDFPLKGTSSGASETIDAAINGGAARHIDVEVRNGSIRLLQLKPQV